MSYMFKLLIFFASIFKFSMSHLCQNLKICFKLLPITLLMAMFELDLFNLAQAHRIINGIATVLEISDRNPISK